jgi:hypothetical protein
LGAIAAAGKPPPQGFATLSNHAQAVVISKTRRQGHRRVNPVPAVKAALFGILIALKNLRARCGGSWCSPSPFPRHGKIRHVVSQSIAHFRVRSFPHHRAHGCHAADFGCDRGLSYAPVPAAFAPPPTWYLRGDVGYAWTQVIGWPTVSPFSSLSFDNT